MAAYESVREVSVVTAVTGGAAAVSKYRFCKWKQPGAEREVVLATGVADNVAGVCSQNPSAKLDPSGAAYMSPAFAMAIPNGGIALVELGEAVTDRSVGLRPGTLGKAFLADATGDRIVGFPMELGSIGQIIAFQFTDGAQLRP